MALTTGSDWLACVDNPEAISSLYDQVPTLTYAVLHRLALNEHGWVCNFTVAIATLPNRRPKRWSEAVNTVQIEFGIAELITLRMPRMESWPESRAVQLKFVRNAGEVLVKAKGRQLELDLTARRLYICSVIGVQTEGLWDTPACPA